MNVIYYFAEDETPMTQWQRIHIFDELYRYGVFIEVFNPLKFKSIEEANEKLYTHIIESKNKFDIFMTCVGSEFIFKDTVTRIGQLGLNTLLICFDNFHAPYMHRKIAASFDLVWLTSIETKWMFEKWGCKNIIVQSYAANPYLFKPRVSQQVAKVCFVGTPYGSRSNKINLLTNNAIPCDVYADSAVNKVVEQSKQNKISDKLYFTSKLLSFEIGRKVICGAILNKIIHKDKAELIKNDFLTINPSVGFQDMLNIYSDYSLSLNITELRNTYVLKSPLHKIHLRTFEIPMSGGLEFSSFTDELAGYFEDGREIVLYNTHEEYISKAKFYLNPKNETLCRNMKLSARIRAESDHTWIKRFDNVLENLGFQKLNR